MKYILRVTRTALLYAHDVEVESDNAENAQIAAIEKAVDDDNWDHKSSDYSAEVIKIADPEGGIT